VAVAGHRGDLGAARSGLDDPDPTVRASALGAVARLGELQVRDLRKALGDDDPRVRRRAAEEAARFPQVTAQVVRLLSDPDAFVVEAAAWALGEHGLAARRAVAALSEVSAGHADPLCREAAVAALGAIGDPAGLGAILAATGDKPAVRRRAVLALAPFEGPQVDEALARARLDRDWQVRQAAEDLSSPA